MGKPWPVTYPERRILLLPAEGMRGWYTRYVGALTGPEQRNDRFRAEYEYGGVSVLLGRDVAFRRMGKHKNGTLYRRIQPRVEVYPCPMCGAKPGARCVTPGRDDKGGWNPHYSRCAKGMYRQHYWGGWGPTEQEAEDLINLWRFWWEVLANPAMCSSDLAATLAARKASFIG